MLYLKQSTASQSVLIGPFVDDTDGTTAETGLTIANTDIRVSKNGGNLAAKTSGGGTHDEAGWYQATFDATDTDTLGRLQWHVKVAGALMVHGEASVLPANVYDSMFSTDKLEVDVAQFGGTNLTASAGRPEVNTTHAAGTAWGSGAITAGAIASDAITAAKIAAGAIDNATFAADVGTTAYATNNIALAADKALVQQKLDHLVAVADADDPVDDSIVAKLASTTADWSTFSATTDALDTLAANQADISTRTPAALVSGRMDADVGAISTSTTAADNLEASALGIVVGTVNTGVEASTTTTFQSADVAEATADHYIGRVVIFYDSADALYGQATTITDYALNGAEGLFTVDALTEAPADADKFVIV